VTVRGSARTGDPVSNVEPEVHTVSCDHAVVYRGGEPTRYDSLAPDADHDLDGIVVRTLPRPAGELLATIATVNDVHIGEVECGRVHGREDIGPVLSAEPGERPYPELMSAAAVDEIGALDPDLVVAKGDLTSVGSREEYEMFGALYRPAFGERLAVTLGNHDHPAGGACFEPDPVAFWDLEGVTVALVDTTRAGDVGGHLDAEQLDRLDDRAARADRPVLVFAHHPVSDPELTPLFGEGGGLDETSSAELVALVARRPTIAGFFAGHTHRNRVHRFSPTGKVPFAEVASTKDFPGSWAEYRVHEGGILAVHHRIGQPAALAWSERCRAMYFGLYPRWALGELEDRCYVVR
jgi:Icc protein